MGIIILIPAFEPGEQLVELVSTLRELQDERDRRTNGERLLLIVDDGSSPACGTIFSRCLENGKVRLLRHHHNCGKGAALRTGFRHVLEKYPHVSGVISADSDGQHRPEDILRLCEALENNPHSLILGCRDFQGDVPWRSRIGNTLSRFLFRVMFHRHLQDTQTGLRGIPTALLPLLLGLESQRYSYELEMLVTVARNGIPICEVDIETVYESNNESSHFRPVRDSVAIYSTLLRLWLSGGR